MELEIEYNEKDGTLEYRTVGEGTEKEARVLSENLKIILGDMIPDDIEIKKLEEKHRHARNKKQTVKRRQKQT